MAWQTVAGGASFAELTTIIGDMELPKGTRVKVVMDLKLPLGWVFDTPMTQLAFGYLIPDGMKLIDVYGEGSQGIVEMEADPAWLLALLAFVKAHWVAILIATFVLGLIILFIRVMVEIVGPGPFGVPWWAWIVGGAAIGVPIIMSLLKKRREKV